MLSKLWVFLIGGSIIYSLINETYRETMQAAITASSDTITFMLTLLGIMCFFNGMMKIAERTDFTKVIGKVLGPVLRLLFKDVPPNSDAFGAMTLNITANLLGLGNAATPLGIKAMQKLQELNTDKSEASDSMCLFTVMNTASLQLIPTTILALRMSYGSTNPYFIILPIWICSFTGLTCGIIAAKYFKHKDERELMKYKGSKKNKIKLKLISIFG